MKALSIRLDDKLGRELDRLCRSSGLKKNTLISRLIERFALEQKPRAKETILKETRGKWDRVFFSEVIGGWRGEFPEIPHELPEERDSL